MYAGLIKPMVEYDRKIRYLDYMENGQRCQGAGFIKLERRDELCNISLQISGVYRRDRFTRPFLLLTENGERELCKLQFADGGIKTCFEGLDSRNLGGQGISYEQLYGMRIPISDGKEIRCVWRRIETASEMMALNDSGVETMRDAGAASEAAEPETGAKLEPRMGAESEMRANLEMQGEPDVYRESGAGAEGESIYRSGAEAEARMRAEAEARTGAEPGNRAELHTGTQPISHGKSAKTVFKEDKWEQLWMIYPHVHPFGDEREYLSVGPEDFVLLGRKSYKLVGNSFLLHGYYNFQHLILMKGGRQGQDRFYIGVPGNLYEREKRTALMFGFQGFECNREPAEEGDFGYFLIPVEL